MNKEVMYDSKEVKNLIELAYENNLRMENSILRTIIDTLLRRCPDLTFEKCYNNAILEMVKKNK